MDWLSFLNAMENTLNEIEVKGKQNMDYLVGCFIAIDKAREIVIQQSQGGEENGEQADSATPTGDSSQQ